MKKRLFTVFTGLATATSMFADSGQSGISDATDGIASYLPYVQALCYAIAAVIAIVGAISVYASMQTASQQTSKRIMMTVGSCLTFVCMAIALPRFFGMDGSNTGSSSSSGSSSGGGSADGFLASDQGGISESGIITIVPGLGDENTPWIHFPSGTNMTVADHVADIYSHFGNGSEGSYGRTIDYINELYHSGEYDYATYTALMSAAGNLPHN